MYAAAPASSCSTSFRISSGDAGARFVDAGYGFFPSYDPLGRISLVDLQEVPASPAPVPGGHNFDSIVSDETKAEVEALKAAIIAGTQKVDGT